MEAPQPRNNPFLIGHEEAEQLFLNAWKAGTIHHAWLISGPEGIGKATFAYRIARFLLSADESRRLDYKSLNISENNPVYRLVAGDSHPDLKSIERDFIESDKKKINPMIGAAGISAFPMSGRVVHKMGIKEDPQNFLLMQSIGVNVSGQIASVIAGGLILNFFM